jgi:capsular exopolysaccharide synthesis family protein
MRDLASQHDALDFERDLEEEGLDLRHYWSVVWGRKWVIMGLAFMVTLLAALWVTSVTPTYQSTATILIENRQGNVVSIQQVAGSEFSRFEFIPTQVGILQSRELAKRLVERMNLVNHPEYRYDPDAKGFNWRAYLPVWMGGKLGAEEEPPPTPEEIFDNTIKAVMEALTVTPVRNSMLVEISYEAHDAKLAAKVPNELAEVYIESDLEAKLQMTEKATSWLTERLEGLRQNLEASEQVLQAYREKAGIVETGTGDTTSSRLDQLNTRLVEARQERVRAEAIYQQVRDLGTKDLERLESIPAVQSHPSVQAVHRGLVEAQLKVSELSQRYGPKHPKMTAAVSARDAARRETHAQIRKVIQGIEKEYQFARSNEASLAREVAGTRSEVQDIDRKEYQLRVFERDVESNRELYDLFLSRSKETGVSADLQSAIARVVDFATVSALPYKPNKTRIVLVALVLGLLLGGLLAFLLEHLDNTFKSTDEVERRLGLAVLGMLPLLKIGGKSAIKRPERAFEEEPKGTFSEAVRTIRTGVVLSGLDNPHKVIVVTSSVPSEGKSTVSINLALALSHMERVLLIDADMRRPTLARHLELGENAPGLSALVAGTAKGSECVHKLGKLDIIPSGIVPPNPLELLSSKRFAEVIDKLGEIYDRIVIDSAPTQAVSDSLMLSRLASAVVYVVKADATPYHLAEQGIKRLQHVNAPLLGVVLNQLDTRKAARYYGKYGYYKGGYGAYGYGN